MKNITNAYLVLSVANIRAMLHAAELEQKVRGEARESVTIVLDNLTIIRDGHDVQIDCGSVVNATYRHTAESINALEDAAMCAAAKACWNLPYAASTPMNHSDAAI